MQAHPGHECHGCSGGNVHRAPDPQQLGLCQLKGSKSAGQGLRPIYTAATAEPAAAQLDTFETGLWGSRFSTVVAAWRRVWDQMIPFFAFAPEVRGVIYTTSAIECVHAQLRKIIKTCGCFPSDDAATKLIWLALRNITAD